jgi:hypothetical protein
MTDRTPAPVELSDLLGRRLPGGLKVADLLVLAEGPAWEVRAIVSGDNVYEAHWEHGELALGRVVVPTGLTSLKHDVLDRQVVDTDDRRVDRGEGDGKRGAMPCRLDVGATHQDEKE